jgi:anhydro-N-acetylmuramic acid kinase
MKVIGLMSGTSADGVDAALVEIHGSGHNLHVKPVAFHTYPYAGPFHTRLLSALADSRLPDVCHLHAVLGEWFARAALRLLREADVPARRVGLIGSHGQTFHHLPLPMREPGIGPVRSTLQLGAAAVIAERTGITTVSDFRMRDMAAGGEGAPLTPYVHNILFRHRSATRVVVNIGGISNLTYLPSRQRSGSVRAFDTGPGNMVMDGLVRHLTNQREGFDRNGRLAAKGKVHENLLRQLLRHPFLRRRPPKSTGREEFGEAFLRDILRVGHRPGLAPADLIATVTAFTAFAIADAQKFLPAKVDEVLVCGGGARNSTLMQMLQSTWGSTPVRPVEALGWDGRAIEAIAFAVLAYQAVHNVACNLPSVTGARRKVVLGAVTSGRSARGKLSF